MIPTVNVTARLHDQKGMPVAGALVSMRLTVVERYRGYVVPQEARAVTDENGEAVLAVWPNELGSESSEYKVTVQYPETFLPEQCACPSHHHHVPSRAATGQRVITAFASVPNADCFLWDILELPPYELRGAGQVITEEVAGYANQAVRAADDAGMSAESASVCRDEACACAVDAAVSADQSEASNQGAQQAAEISVAKAGEAGRSADQSRKDANRAEAAAQAIPGIPVGLFRVFNFTVNDNEELEEHRSEDGDVVDVSDTDSVYWILPAQAYHELEDGFLTMHPLFQPQPQP